jgi:hypothetical protein
MDKATRLILEVSSGSPDQEELDRAARQLLDEVRESDVQSANVVAGEAAPGGAKAAGTETLGMLAVEVLPAMIPGLFGLLRDWARRHRGRSVKVKAHFGDRELELEYPVESMTQEQLGQFIATVTGAVREGGETTSIE